MSFLNNLFNDPKYQNTDPRSPDQVDDPEVIIKPDTRRDNRIPWTVAHQEVAGAGCARHA
jgi:hypothetical protein